MIRYGSSHPALRHSRAARLDASNVASDGSSSNAVYASSSSAPSRSHVALPLPEQAVTPARSTAAIQGRIPQSVRERPVPCRWCFEPTFNDSAVCDRQVCADVERLTKPRGVGGW